MRQIQTCDILIDILAPDNLRYSDLTLNQTISQSSVLMHHWYHKNYVVKVFFLLQSSSANNITLWTNKSGLNSEYQIQ